MLASEKGFSVIELLIAMAIVGIVLTGIYNLAISSSQFYLSQNAIVEMQAEARAAMDFVARELRLASGTPIISTAATAGDTISFNRVAYTGRSSGGNGPATLNDISNPWPANAFGPTEAGDLVTIVAGPGAGQTRTVSANTANQLTVSPGWGIIPSQDSVYVITINKGFTRNNATENILRYRIRANGNRNPLAENITDQLFQLPLPDTIRITLTARTRSVDPITKQYRFYTLIETVQKRD